MRRAAPPQNEQRETADDRGDPAAEVGNFLASGITLLAARSRWAKLRSSVAARIIFTVLPIVVVATLLVFQVGVAAYMDLRTELLSDVRAVGSSVDADLIATKRLTASLAATANLSDTDGVAFDPIMRRVMAAQPNLQSISLTDLDSGLILAHTALQPGASLPAGPATIAQGAIVARTGLPTIFPLRQSGPTLREPIIPVRAPIYRDGRVIRILTISMSAAHFNATYHGTNFNPNMIGALIDDQLNVVTSNQPLDKLIAAKSPIDLLRTLLAQTPDFSGTVTVPGRQATWIIVRSSKTGWTSVGAVSTAQIAFVVWRAVTPMLILSLLAITIGVASALFVAVRIGRLRRSEQTSLQLYQDQHQQMHAIITTVLEGLITINTSGLVITSNPAAERMFGTADLAGQNARVLISPRYHRIYDRCLRDIRQLSMIQAPGVIREMRGQRNDGSVFSMEVAISAVPIAGCTTIIAVTRDISVRKQADRALRASQESLARAQEVAQVGSFEHNLVSGISFWSDQFYRVLGLEPGVLAPDAATIEKLIVPEDRSKFVNDLAFLSKGGEIRQEKARIELADGRRRTLEFRAMGIFDAKGRPTKFMGTAQDVTVQVEAELALRVARDEADRASSAKDDFLATMSHEIRTPLSGLVGMLELLERSKLDDNQTEMLRIARESGHDLRAIIDDILDYSKLVAGLIVIKLEPTQIASLMRRLVNSYYALASAKNLHLSWYVDPRLSPVLLIDPMRLSQILGNFLSNALKFTASGSIDVHVDELERTGEVVLVRFAVTDTGIGISAETQKRLFQPFEQGSAEIAPTYGGTGLGLSISRSLAHAMGGTIEMESTSDLVGTRMSVTLRLTIVAAGEGDKGALNLVIDPAGAKGTIMGDPEVLVVDDHATNRTLVTRQLAALGLQAQTVDGGEAAFALWQTSSFAMVLTDCNMPGMDGYALTRAIRGIEKRVGRMRTPIIAWTANVLSDAKKQCYDAGMDDILTKPAELAVILAMVTKWLPTSLSPVFDHGIAAQAMPEAVAAEAALDTSPAIRMPLLHDVLDSISANAIDRREILQEFMTQTHADSAELVKAMVKLDFNMSERLAHRIKGASQMVGAHELAGAAGLLETASRNAAQPAMEAAKTALDAAMDRLVEYNTKAAHSDMESFDHDQ